MWGGKYGYTRINKIKQNSKALFSAAKSTQQNNLCKVMVLMRF